MRDPNRRQRSASGGESGGRSCFNERGALSRCNLLAEREMIYENIDITVKKVRLQKNFGKNVQNAAKYLAMSKKSSTFAPSNEKTTIMDSKKTNGETSKAWEASRATQGNVIVLDPKYM